MISFQWSVGSDSFSGGGCVSRIYSIYYGMYIILVYDINTDRVAKMLKLCRRYLNWIQNSVFEGELTEVQVKALKAEARAVMEKGDSLIIFSSRDQRWLEKEVIGEERGETGNFL